MVEDPKTPEALEDKTLDEAQGGYSVELINATVGSIRTEQLPRSGSAGIIAVELDAGRKNTGSGSGA